MRKISKLGFNLWLTHCVAFLMGSLAFFPFESQCVLSLKGIAYELTQKLPFDDQNVASDLPVYALKKVNTDFCLVSQSAFFFVRQGEQTWALFERKDSSIELIRAFLKKNVDKLSYSPHSYQDCAMRQRIRYD